MGVGLDLAARSRMGFSFRPTRISAVILRLDKYNLEWRRASICFCSCPTNAQRWICFTGKFLNWFKMICPCTTRNLDTCTKLKMFSHAKGGVDNATESKRCYLRKFAIIVHTRSALLEMNVGMAVACRLSRFTTSVNDRRLLRASPWIAPRICTASRATLRMGLNHPS